MERDKKKWNEMDVMYVAWIIFLLQLTKKYFIEPVSEYLERRILDQNSPTPSCSIQLFRSMTYFLR